MPTNNVVARFEYGAIGCTLYINDEFVCKCSKFETSQDYDYASELEFLHERRVTHVIDIEVFEDQDEAYPDMPYPLHTLEEWCTLQGY